MNISVNLNRMYQVNYFFGYIVGGGLYYIFCLISPPPGLGIQENMDHGLIDGIPTDLEVASIDQRELDIERAEHLGHLGEKGRLQRQLGVWTSLSIKCIMWFYMPIPGLRP
jgi:hypothetical protein